MNEIPTILPIEGGWSGPWVFARLVAALAKRGIAALTMPPETDGARTWRPSLTSAAALERVQHAIQQIDGPVVLAAHSGGGVEMTSSGGDPRVKHVVYMSAHIPGSGVAPAMDHVMDHAPLDHDGCSRFDSEKARDLFFSDLPPAEQDWAIGALIPLAMGGSSPRPTEPAFRSRPSTYIVFEQDQALLVADQEAYASVCDATYRVDAAHFAFWSKPDAVAEILEAIARAS